MIQKAQSANALTVVTEDFNHINFQKVLERLLLAKGGPRTPLRGTPKTRLRLCRGEASATSVPEGAAERQGPPVLTHLLEL